jgi:hydroxypyruvate isomerase
VIGWSAHLGTLFGELPPLARPAAARREGFDAVEAWWPPAQDIGAWVAAVREAGVRAELVNAFGGDLAAGERGFCNVPGREQETVDAARAAAAVVRACGGRLVNLLVGRCQPGPPLEAQLAGAREVVRAAADEASALGARIVIEHLNPTDVNRPLLPAPADAAAFVREVDHPAVGLLFDAYHSAMAGVDPLEAVDSLEDLPAHVQYADAPGRGAPGTGTIDLGRLVERLEGRGYAGRVGLEFIPDGPTPATLASLPQGRT